MSRKFLPNSDHPNLIPQNYFKRNDIFWKIWIRRISNFITISRRGNILHLETEVKTVFPLWSAYILILWPTFPFCESSGFSNGRFTSAANVTFYTDRIIARNNIWSWRYFILFIEFSFEAIFYRREFTLFFWKFLGFNRVNVYGRIEIFFQIQLK